MTCRDVIIKFVRHIRSTFVDHFRGLMYGSHWENRSTLSLFLPHLQLLFETFIGIYFIIRDRLLPVRMQSSVVCQCALWVEVAVLSARERE